MKHLFQKSNPIFGILLSLGMLLILLPRLFALPAHRFSFYAIGMILILADFVFLFRPLYNPIKISNAKILLDHKGEKVLIPPYVIAYFWTYSSYELPFAAKKYKGSTGYKKSGRIRIRLNILIKDHNGEKILLYQDLPPWRATPSHWEYRVLQEESITKIRVSRIQKIANDLQNFIGSG